MADQTPLVLAIAALRRNQFGASLYQGPKPIFDRIYGQMEVKRFKEAEGGRIARMIISHPTPKLIEPIHLKMLTRELSTTMGERVEIRIVKAKR